MAPPKPSWAVHNGRPVALEGAMRDRPFESLVALEPLEGQPCPAHFHFDPVAPRVRLARDGHADVDRAHDSVAEFFLSASRF